MNQIKSLAFVLVLGAIVFACSGDNQDPLGIDEGDGLAEGRLTKGADGPNVVVTLTNVDSANQTIIEAVFAAFQKAAYATSPISSLNMPARMDGGYEGYAVVDGSVEFVAAAINYDLKATFYDYSDDDLIYFGGSLQYLGSVDNKGITKNLHINDEIKFAGPYAGFIKFNNLLLAIDEQGNLISIFAPVSVTNRINRSGTVTVNSGGNTITKNPYPPPRPEDL